MNKQREVIYTQRREVMNSDDISHIIKDMIADLAEGLSAEFVDPKVDSESWDWEGLKERLGYSLRPVLGLAGRDPRAGSPPRN